MALLKNKGVGLDANGMRFDFNAMHKKSLKMYHNQPVMRSAPVGGVDTVWPIPTVVVVNDHFFFKRRRKADDSLPSVREVCEFYNWICPFCGEKIKSLKDASREHVRARSLGGSNDFSNLVAAHRHCNSLAGNTWPKLDKDGKEIVPQMRIRPNHYVLPHGVKARDEWKDFLFLE